MRWKDMTILPISLCSSNTLARNFSFIPHLEKERLEKRERLWAELSFLPDKLFPPYAKPIPLRRNRLGEVRNCSGRPEKGARDPTRGFCPEMKGKAFGGSVFPFRPTVVFFKKISLIESFDYYHLLRYGLYQNSAKSHILSCASSHTD